MNIKQDEVNTSQMRARNSTRKRTAEAPKLFQQELWYKAKPRFQSLFFLSDISGIHLRTRFSAPTPIARAS